MLSKNVKIWSDIVICIPLCRKEVVKLISPQVHRALYIYSIKRFLKKKKINAKQKAQEYRIDLFDDYGYNHLLDRLIEKQEIDQASIDDFLHDELNYGRMKNVYVTLISNKKFTEEGIIKSVQSLSDYRNANNISTNFFQSDLRRAIPKGEKHLVYFEIKKNGERIQSIHMLFAESYTDPTGQSTNNYIPVEIRMDYGFLVIRLRNWGNNENEEENNLNRIHAEVRSLIVRAFGLYVTSNASKEQLIVSSMLGDLTNTVLNPTINQVDSKLKKVVELDIDKWTEKIFEQNVMPKADREILVNQILHNYYKIHLVKTFGGTTISKLKQLKVEGYPRNVKFLDDTIGEARARSNTPKESLLDTSIFYDIKARLDQAKQIRMCTIYWINAPGYQRLGTTFHTTTQKQFKFIILANFFTKEISEYVLRQVKKYS